MTAEIQGACLCGAVRYAIGGPLQRFHLCHCSRCRKATGSAHAANIFTGPQSIRWLAGRDQVARFDLPTAERFARCFCQRCGAPVPHLSRDGRWLIVPAGGLEQDPGIRPQDHIFWQDRAPWYDAAADLPRHDAYPPDPPAR